MTAIIEVKNVGKKYNINRRRGGYVALRDIIATVLKNPFRFTKKKVQQMIGVNTKEEFWALKGINFTIEQGEVVGIIGPNGAGKSTLLKILSQITPPTQGEIIMRGKVGSLLEVGTGFHPELSGRENIFLNGAILGMGRAEIAKKFNDIVEFAGIEKFLDTPVKYYSSGMYVRLAFSVAAHLDPDILLVDEVLAVGDAEFQKKCLGKMEEASQKSGRTILFISHNMSAIKSLCKRSILIEGGQVKMIGETDAVVNFYLSSVQQNQKSVYEFGEQHTPASIDRVTMQSNDGTPQSELPISEDFSIRIDFTCKEKVSNAVMALLFYSPDRDLLLYSTNADRTGTFDDYEPGSYTATVTVPAFLMNIGRYSLDLMLCTPNVGVFGEQKNLGFEITNLNNPRSAIFWKNHVGKIATPLDYAITKKTVSKSTEKTGRGKKHEQAS